MKGMKLLWKYLLLFLIGGFVYLMIEVFWRGHSHWTMFLLGGICFIALGLINEVIPWKMALWKQALIGDCLITILELIAGYILNLKLHMNIWDYSKMPGNVLGQICPLYMILWIPVAVMGIILDDWARHFLFHERKPVYHFF